MIYYILKFLLLPFYYLFRMPKVIGRENLKSIKEGKAIIICNHRTMLDPLFIALCSNRFVHFMAKAELFEKKLMAWLLKNLLAFPVNRKASDLKSIKTAIKVLDEGKVFGIFPEGKRAVTDEMDVFENGAAFLAVKSMTPILPMYIPVDNFRLFKRPRLYIGKLITTDTYNTTASKSVAMRALTANMEAAINELKNQAEAEE